MVFLFTAVNCEHLQCRLSKQKSIWGWTDTGTVLLSCLDFFNSIFTYPCKITNFHLFVNTTEPSPCLWAILFKLKYRSIISAYNFVISVYYFRKAVAVLNGQICFLALLRVIYNNAIQSAIGFMQRQCKI